MVQLSELASALKQTESKGVFSKHPKGFGFVHPEGETDKTNDIYIGQNETKFAMDGDKVTVKVLYPKTERRGASGQIIKINERAVVDTVGTYRSLSNRQAKALGYKGRIELFNDRISDTLYIKQALTGVQEEDVVSIKVTQYPTDTKAFEGKITQIIGHKGEVGLDILEVLYAMKIPQEFSAETLAEAESFSEELTQEDLKGREDYRNEITYTIDGEDSKDLDDAIHVKKLSNGHFELGVHIADVSHYVTEGSSLNEEAYARATSVYVTDRVVPMLPVRLSNNLCSLNEAQERLTMSCLMEIDDKGKIITYKISP